jgi:hypothetical protein
MNLESYLNTQSDPAPQVESISTDSDSLETLIHGKGRILEKKLDILAAEMKWRLHLTLNNLTRLDDDQTEIRHMLADLDRDAHYHLRQHQEKAPLYRQWFGLEAEKRSQQTDCWRDVVAVMRDFLAVWEAHEQSRERAAFIHNVGSGTEGAL